jgi:hypothetical protein
MTQTVTTKDIAEKIKRPGEDQQIAVDRLKNWTREGLLKTVGEKNPGKGRSRQYSQSALLDALLLQTLVDCIGPGAMGAIVAGELLGRMKKRALLRPFYSDSTNIDAIDDCLVVIARRLGDPAIYSARCGFSTLQKTLMGSIPVQIPPGCAVFSIIDLRQVFKPIAKED